MRSSLVWIALIVTASTTSHADTAAADKLAAEAEALAGGGQFVAAAAKFRAAFAEDPRPDLMCNVGVAFYKAKDLPRAHHYLDQCLAIGTQLDATFIDNVRAVLATVTTSLGAGEFTPVDLVVEPATAQTTIVGSPFDESIVGSRRVWLPFGHYRATIHAEGFVDQASEIDARSHDASAVRTKLVRAAAFAPPALPGPVADPPSKLPAIAATAATVVLGAVAGGFYLKARSVAQDAGLASDMVAYHRLADSAKSWQHGSWFVGGVAGAGALVSAYLWYRATRSPAQLEVDTTGGGATVSIRGTW